MGKCSCSSQTHAVPSVSRESTDQRSGSAAACSNRTWSEPSAQASAFAFVSSVIASITFEVYTSSAPLTGTFESAKIDSMIDERIVAESQRHAALGEPHRLAVAEALGHSDLSPQDLANRLGIGSNLMAHHIAVLVEAGIVSRSPSEADRRRVYLTLTPAGRRLVQPAALPTSRVLFVCTHNSARSKFAEALWRGRSGVPVASAGTHPARRVHPLARRVGRRHGLDLGTTGPAELQPADLQDSLVVTVCDRADDELNPLGVDHLHWSVPDPATGGSADDFEAALDRIQPRIENLLELTQERS